MYNEDKLVNLSIKSPILSNRCMLVTPNVAIFIFILIVVIAIILALWMKDYQSYDKSAFHTFIAILIGLGIFVTFMFYYNLVQLQHEQQNLVALQELGRINDSVLNSLLTNIDEASKTIPSFVLSLNPLSVCCSDTVSFANSCGITGPDPINAQTCTEKMSLSLRIFAMWQDVIVSNKIIKNNPLPYVSNFLQRANSSQLYEQWLVNKLNYAAKTQSLGDLLFQYGLPITVQLPQTYIDTAQQLINSQEFQDIIN